MLFLKNTTAVLAPGVYLVDVAAKPPGQTFGIYMALDAENLPEALLSAIESLGFKCTRASPYTHQDGKKIVDRHYHKKGTGIFDGWTAAEKAANLQDIEEIFAKHQIKIAPRIMSLAEAF